MTLVDGSDTHSSADITLNTPTTSCCHLTDDVGDLKSTNGAQQISSSVPWQGFTFIICYPKTGEVLTHIDGEVVLAKPGGGGCIHWDSVDNDGWYGFRNKAPGRFIGSDHPEELVFNVSHHKWCEHFIARPVPEGGYHLLMRHNGNIWNGIGDKLRLVGLKEKNGKRKLAKVEGAEGIVWGFVRI